MTDKLAEAKKLIGWKEDFCDLFCPYFGQDGHEARLGNKCATSADNVPLDDIVIFIDQLLAAQDLISREEQRKEDAMRLESLLEQNLETEEYFGVFGTVNNKQFIEDFKNP